MEAFINGISHYLPEKVLDNSELSSMFPEWSVEKISQKTGIVSRHIADEDESSSDMAIKALENFIHDYNFDKSRIDYLILCTQTPDYLLPTTACIIQDKAGLSKKCGAIDVNLGCSGYIYGLGLAKGLVSTGQAKNVILLTSEMYSKIIHPKDKSNRTIFGDGATATLITSEPNNDFFSAKIKNFKYGTDGSGFDHLIVKNSGIKIDREKQKDFYDEEENFVSNDDYLYMNGKEIFNFTAFEVPKLVVETLETNCLSLSEIDMVIFHQANAFMLDFIRKRCGIDSDKFYVSMSDIGNTVSSTIPIALSRVIKENRFKTNQQVLLCGFGVGLSMAGVVIEIC
ncbi:3-oxoacyl-ACP synthase III family protein [Flavobacterium sp. IB48]|uniref:3-oxoacyl-ACP synthase III family protein n=1 Tax=Flavobacterium sp. IB48 TaxID=2779375 RepID=UPI0018E7E7C1|nr:ketoacyl-ACP synthase III [Flavobacterium sp. IB48]MBJ2126452.1 ketoacyl-ACP synthase III [Flavobacterium sp. IB48]